MNITKEMLMGSGMEKKRHREIISDEEFYLISNLIQDIRLITKGLASSSYEEQVNDNLKEHCDNQETINGLKADNNNRIN